MSTTLVSFGTTAAVLNSKRHTQIFKPVHTVPCGSSIKSFTSCLSRNVPTSVCSRRSHSHKRSFIRGSIGGIPGGQDQPPLGTVLRIFMAVKNRLHLRTFSGELPSSLAPIMGTLDGKKHAVTVMAILLGLLTKNIQFLVKPNSNNGIDLGFMLTLMWNNTFSPFGKGISFFASNFYEGKVYIRNVEILKKPVDDMRLKLSDISTSMLNKISKWTSTEEGQMKPPLLYFLATVSMVALSLIFLKRI